MTESLQTLGLVVARGGSKGIPGKNIRLLGGKPLLAYTAEAAQGAARLSRTILSTDSEEIAEIGRDVGLEVPFLRTENLARDDTPTLPVVQHALDTLGDGDGGGARFDAVCLLQPTHPFRIPGLIDRCIEQLGANGVESVFTVSAVPHQFNPHWVYFRGEDGTLRISTGDEAAIPRRQELPPALAREGSVYVTRTSTILAGSLYGATFRGVEVDPTFSVNLDTEADWRRAEELIAIQQDRGSES